MTCLFYQLIFYDPYEHGGRRMKSQYGLGQRYSEQILAWLESNYKQKRVLERLAAELFLSPSHISHLFHQETGSTLSVYVTARRIREACSLLGSTSMSIQDISKRIGYGSAAYFCRVFKRHLGLTPHEYRRNIVNSP